MYHYKTSGTCARNITLELDGNIIRKVEFDGGCAGNLAGISQLVAGMPAEHVIQRFRGTPCNHKRTSCPDQLSLALEAALNQAAADADKLKA
ncbi:MAG: TIGR03905 family TSCPD domain-containing protein [Oscillospiraceae bacterium]|nr:TIGR03905 family TSCPD domain-containing protein [Oscillospiraceae bacterium]